MKERRRASLNETELHFIGITRIQMALRAMDEFREQAAQAEIEFKRAINHPQIPQHIRKAYWEFWKAGGCTGDQWRNFVRGKLPKDAVKARRGLRLVVKNRGTTPRKRPVTFKDDGPRAA
jgi:hypothetical protein